MAYNGKLADRFTFGVLGRSIPANKALHSVVSVQEYIQHQFDDCFVQLFLPLLQTVALPQPIPTEQLRHPDLRRLEDLTVLLVLFLNDFVSYAKERATCTSPSNIVHLFSTTQFLDTPQAHSLTVAYINDYYEEFLLISQRRTWSKPAEAYIEAMQRFVFGFMDWSQSAYRYTAGDS